MRLFKNLQQIRCSIITITTTAPPGFRFGRGDIFWGWPRKGSGGRAPRTPENCENFLKNSQENCKKIDYFRRFSIKFKNPALNFRALDEKHNCLGNFLRKFSKISLKNSKKCILLADSQQNFKIPALFFREFGRKIQIVG